MRGNLEIQIDGNGSKYVQWHQTEAGIKRAWIQRKTGEADWAKTGRYLNVVRCGDNGKPAGNATDFPVFNTLPDEQILWSFVYATSSITGCEIKQESNNG